MNILQGIAVAIFGLFAAAIVAVLVGLVVLMLFSVAAVAAGDFEERYRCKDGVTQSRGYAFGVGLLPWEAIDGDSVSVTRCE